MKKLFLLCALPLLCFAQDCCCPYEGPLFYESCYPAQTDLTFALDDFRGIYSGSWPNAFGGLIAANLTFPLTCSFSLHFAGSYGLYNWAGRGSTPSQNSKSFEQQGFATAAMSWLTAELSGLNAGVAYDWVFNQNFGLFAVDPFFDQIRGQIGYVFDQSNEIGAWGAYAIRTVHEESQNLPLQFKGISQVNLFWTHYFENSGYTMIWAGTPYQRGLLYTSGRPGRFIVGAQFSAPLTDHLSIDGHGSYMYPKDGSGVIPSRNYGAELCIGITYSYGKRRVAKNPYMTLANNTNFMTDTNQNF